MFQDFSFDDNISEKVDSLLQQEQQPLQPIENRQQSTVENFYNLEQNNENVMIEPTKKLQTCHNYATNSNVHQIQSVSSPIPIKTSLKLKNNEIYDEEDEFEQEDYLSGDEFNTFSSSEGTSSAGRMGEEPQLSGGYNKPSYSYSCLIGLSLKNSISGELTVSEIYTFLW